MVRGRWRYIDGELREWNYVKPESQAPNVIDDTMEPVMSHATDEGLIFDSKSAIRAHYKQHGFEDTGGSHLTGRGLHEGRYKADKEAIRHELLERRRRIQWGMEPMTEKEKAQWEEEERQYKAYAKRQR